MPPETGAHRELPLDILASEALRPPEEAKALNEESGNLCLFSNNGVAQKKPCNDQDIKCYDSYLSILPFVCVHCVFII